MTLVIEFQENRIWGTLYYFLCFVDGTARNVIEGDRLHFNGEDHQECLKAAYEYMSDIKSNVSQYYFKQVLDKVTSQYSL